MKVLYISHDDGFYGANRSLLQLILELKKISDIEPFVIVPKKGIFTNELLNTKIPFATYKYYNWLSIDKGFLKPFLKRVLNRFLFYKIYTSLSKKYNFQIAHTNSSVTHLGGYLSKKMKIPHLWHIREYGAEDYDLSYSIGNTKAGLYFEENATKVVAISEDLRKYYSRYISSKKIKVIYNGVKREAKFEKKWNISFPLRICFAGSISQNKNQLEAIKACENLIKIEVTDFRLYILGDGENNYHSNLKEYVKQKKLENYVIFMGYVPDISKFLERYDIGVVCSKREAFGRVTAEYLMHKMPVIACDTGANKEIIEHGKSGYIYPYGNHIVLAKYIKRYIDDRKKIEVMGNHGHKRAIIEFLSKKNAKRILETYIECMS